MADNRWRLPKGHRSGRYSIQSYCAYLVELIALVEHLHAAGKFTFRHVFAEVQELRLNGLHLSILNCYEEAAAFVAVGFDGSNGGATIFWIFCLHPASYKRLHNFRGKIFGGEVHYILLCDLAITLKVFAGIFPEYRL